VDSSLRVVETDGDRHTEVPLDRLGGRGIFVKEVQAAVARGDADAAVHSAKDLPSDPALSVPGLVVAAFPERVDTRDLLVGSRLDSLPTGATVATGSARRRVQLANLRPDLTFAGLRGNLATRAALAGTASVVAVVLAKAAVDRLGWSPPNDQETEVLAPTIMLPQVGQGALAVECRVEDAATRTLLAAIDDPEVEPLVTAERAFLAELGGGCTLPVGANAQWAERGAGSDPEEPDEPGENADNARITLAAMIASADGVVMLRHTSTGHDPHELGRAVASYLLNDAGGADLADWSPVPGREQR
jgi:hydroxymethylbilane synthase